MATAMPTPPALPVLEIVQEAFASVSQNWGAVLRICWAWVLILCVTGLAMAATFPQEGMAPSFAFIAACLLFLAAFVVGFSSIAVAWHRFMLLREQPPSLNLGVRGQVLPYIGRFIVIGLIAGVIQVVCSSFLLPILLLLVPVTPNVTPSTGTLLALGLLGFVISLPAILVGTRLAVALPGTAIGRPMTLGDSMRVTKGNTWRLFGGSLLVYVPSYVISFVLGLVTDASWMGNLATLLLYCVYFFSMVAAISFLSLSYRFLVGEGRGA
jgi:hypothetical protein